VQQQQPGSSQPCQTVQVLNSSVAYSFNTVKRYTEHHQQAHSSSKDSGLNMGQDFVARKAAKKQRKRSARDAETGRKQKRKRKEDGFEVAGGVFLCLGPAVMLTGAKAFND
jgi:hypothetical protein